MSEDQTQDVAFLVGRMNPPTPGHIELIHELIEYAKTINAIPLAYITLSYNVEKFSEAQKKKYIKGITNAKKDAKPDFPYVKHKSYENPLNSMMKKQIIQNMLYNKYGLTHAETDQIIRVEPRCNGIYKAFGCVRSIQSDPNKLHFVMGKELDADERASREKICLRKSSGEVVAQTEDGSLVNCHFLNRTEGEGLSGLSGSKVRLLAAEGNYNKLYDVYNGYLTRQQVNELVKMIYIGLNFEKELINERETKMQTIRSQSKSSNKTSSHTNTNSSPTRKLKRKRHSRTKRKMSNSCSSSRSSSRSSSSPRSRSRSSSSSSSHSRSPKKRKLVKSKKHSPFIRTISQPNFTKKARSNHTRGISKTSSL